MRRSLGLAVFSGMLGVTLFGIFLTPVFYYVIQWRSRWPAKRRTHPLRLAQGRRDDQGVVSLSRLEIRWWAVLRCIASHS